jgi:hypothetical protein
MASIDNKKRPHTHHLNNWGKNSVEIQTINLSVPSLLPTNSSIGSLVCCESILGAIFQSFKVPMLASNEKSMK